MSTHLILGAGPTGRAAAHSLIRRNQQVKVGTRSRTPVPQCLSLRLDATDAAALATAATNCESIIVCVNPPYPEWPEEWPPIIESVIAAARATGSRIVLMGNLYPFGRQTRPFTGASLESPTEPKGATRAQLWRMLKQADDLYVTELRASDYFGPGAGIGSIVGDEFIDPILAGGVAKVVGDPTVPHAWSYLPDIGECLAILATNPQLSDRYWVGPVSGNVSLTDFAHQLNPNGKVKQISGMGLTLAGLTNPMMREIKSVLYQYTQPYVVDATELEQAFGFVPTPLADAIAATAAAATG